MNHYSDQIKRVLDHSEGSEYKAKIKFHHGDKTEENSHWLSFPHSVIKSILAIIEVYESTLDEQGNPITYDAKRNGKGHWNLTSSIGEKHCIDQREEIDNFEAFMEVASCGISVRAYVAQEGLAYYFGRGI